MAWRYCPSCGAALHETWRFCAGCGIALFTVAMQQPPSTDAASGAVLCEDDRGDGCRRRRRRADRSRSPVGSDPMPSSAAGSGIGGTVAELVPVLDQAPAPASSPRPPIRGSAGLVPSSGFGVGEAVAKASPTASVRSTTSPESGMVLGPSTAAGGGPRSGESVAIPVSALGQAPVPFRALTPRPKLGPRTWRPSGVAPWRAGPSAPRPSAPAPATPVVGAPPPPDLDDYSTESEQEEEDEAWGSWVPEGGPSSAASDLTAVGTAALEPWAAWSGSGAGESDEPVVGPLCTGE
jgi:hypothetical protein